MLRKMVVSPENSLAIGSFGLPRETLLDLLAHVYHSIPGAYASIHTPRMADTRLFRYRFVSTDHNGVGHLFLFGIDDTTSPEHLIIAQLQHRIV